MLKKALFPAAVVMVLFLSMITVIPDVDGASGPSAVEVNLYLHSNRSLSTLPQESTEVAVDVMAAGQPLEYELTFPLTGDMEIGPMGSDGILLHLEGVNINAFSTDLVLTVELFEDTIDDTSLLIASGEFDGAAISEGNFPLNILRTSLGKGSTVRLLMTLEGGGTLPSFQFLYRSISGESSSTAFMSDPMPEDDLWLRMESADGREITEILPNGPPETREVYFKSRVRDLFGAYDVEEVTISMIGTGDAYIFNQTESPTPGGGQEYTYLNFSREIDPIPSGTYTISMRALSNTDRISYLNTTLDVSPGLFLSMPEPDPREVDAGEQATFMMDVLNGGSSMDRVTFSGHTSSGWNVVSAEPVDIEPGGEESVEYTVDVPFSASSGHMEVVTLEARSRNAEKTYSSEGEIEVMMEATFGISMKSASEVSLFSGMSTNFTIKLSNLMNQTETFELWLEGFPQGWSSGFEAVGGEASGTRYEVPLDGSSSETVTLDVTVPASDDGGQYSFKVKCKQVGESEVRGLSVEMLVVDDSFPPFSLSEGTDTEASDRSGYGFPVSYQQVTFYLTVYNPTLDDRTIDLLADGPDGWGIDLDEAPFDLAGGEREDRVLRISPKQGEEWRDGGYTIEVGAFMGAGLEETLELTVELEKIRDILIEPEKNTLSGRSGDTLGLNFTVTNRGNVDESGTISFDLDDGLTVNRTGIDLTFTTGQSGVVKCTLTLGSVSKEEILKVVISMDVNSGPTVTSDVQVKVRPGGGEDNGEISYLMWIIIAVLIIGLAVGGYFLYTRKLKNSGDSQQKEVKKEPQFDPVSISADSRKKAKPVRPPPDDEVLGEADRLAAQLLDDDNDVVTMKVESVEVVSAKVLE